MIGKNWPRVVKNIHVFVFVIISMVVLLGTRDVFAISTSTINLQGKIVRNDTGHEGLNVTPGNPACVVAGANNDTCDFRVRYYDASSGGTLLLTETFSDKEIGQYNGAFNLSLGSDLSPTTGKYASLSSLIDGEDEVYIEIGFAPGGNNSYTETFTRMPLQASPYAIRSKYASEASSVSWSGIINPEGNQSLTMGAHDTSWNWGTGLFSSNWNSNVGVNDLFTLSTGNITGTGSLLNVQTGSSATVSPLRVRAGSNEAIFVDNQSRVGIGTTSPAVKLDVAGQGRFESSTFPVVEITRDTGSSGGGIYGGARLQRKTTSPANGGGIGFFFMYPNSAGVSKHAGMFGGALATTTAGSEIGEIVFGASYNGVDPYQQRHLIIRAANGGAGEVRIPYRLKIGADSSPTKPLDVTGDAIISGDVGIGTTSPLYKLDVNGSLRAGSYYSSDGTQGVTSTVSGLVFKDGLYTSGGVSGFDNYGYWTLKVNNELDGSNITSQGVVSFNGAGIVSTSRSNNEITITGIEADTLGTVTGRGATTSTSSSFTGGATIRGLTVDHATGTRDKIAISVADTGTSSYTGTITNADLTAARTWTLPNATGTLALTSDIAVSSVSNSDGTLTISPTTGDVIASLNLNNANTWTAAQTFSATPLTLSANSAVLSFSSSIGVKSITTGGTTHLALSPGGNVGIGTTSPTQALHVEGGIRLGSTTNPNNVLNTATTGGAPSGSLYWGNAALLTSTTGVTSITGTTNQVLVNAISGTPQTGAVTLTTPQDIATTSTPQFARLGIGAAANGTYLLNLNGALIHGSSTGVGVGTTSIGAKLDVNGSIRSSSQLISTVATGTAPLAVTSTTVVTNLNADRVDSIHASSTPTANYLLPLDSALRFNAPLYIPDTRSAATTPGSYNQEAAWNFKSNSTIGLSSAGSFSGVLGVGPWTDDSGGGGHEVAFSADGNLYHRSGTRSAGWNSWAQLLSTESLSSNAWLLGGNTLSGTGILGTKSNHSLQFITNNTDRMIITNGGNVGIGTTSPSAKLELANSGSATSGLRISYSTPSAGQLDIYTRGNSPAGPVIEASSTGGYSVLIFRTGSADRMFINPSGNVGIGTTSPTSILHTVASGAKTASYVGNLLTNTATSSTASVVKTGLSIESTGTWNGTNAVNRGLYVNATGGTTNYSAIFEGGNVGIGTTSPGHPLAVSQNIVSNGYYGIMFQDTSTANSDVILGRIWAGMYGLTRGGRGSLFLGSTNANTSNGSYIILRRVADGGHVSIYPGDGGGGVGIGTDTPSEKLHVTGGIRLGTTSHANNVLNTSGAAGAPSGSLYWGNQSLAYSSDIPDSWLVGGNNLSADSILGSLNNYAVRIFTNNTERVRIAANGNVGIGTTSPSTRLHIANDGGILAQGTYGSGWNGGTLGAGTRLMWIPSKAAFRAGYVDSTQWNAANIGDYSVAMGYNTIASGEDSTAMGSATTAYGYASTAMGSGTTASGRFATAMGHNTTANADWYSTAMGSGTIASGNYSIAMGSSTTASGWGSTAMGNDTTASGDVATAIGDNTIASGAYSTAMGYYTTAQAYASTILGQYNVVSGTTGSWVATDPIFAIGIGTGSSNRANAMTVLKNGKTGIGTTSPGAMLSVNTSTYPTIELKYNDNKVMDIFSNTEQNVFIGKGSGSSITTGLGNVGIGLNTLASHTAGHSNMAIGTGSLGANTTGSYNIGVGVSTLLYNETGVGNVANGFLAMFMNTGGSYNVALGYGSLSGNTTGGSNVAIGNGAGNNITTGSNNIIIGAGTTAPSAINNYQLNIGNTIRGDLNNNRIGIGTGTSSLTQALEINGQIKITGGSPGANKVLVSDASGVGSWQTFSPGSSSVRWDEITNPLTNQILGMSGYRTEWTWSSSNTSTNNLFTLKTANSTTGTGSLLNLETGSDSAVNPLHIVSAGVEALFVSSPQGSGYNSRIGLGTASPLAMLHLQMHTDENSTDYFMMMKKGNTEFFRFEKQGRIYFNEDVTASGFIDKRLYRRGDDLYWDGKLLINSDNISSQSDGYTYVTTLYFNSNSTFKKGDYPWLAAIKVKVQGGGGGGGGAVATSSSQQTCSIAGGGGGYAESFITDMAGLSSSIAVTRGVGGNGGSTSGGNGSSGGASSFGTLVVANGGAGGTGSGAGATWKNLNGANGGTVSAGDLQIPGGNSGQCRWWNDATKMHLVDSSPGGSYMSSAQQTNAVNANAVVGKLYGGGGGSVANGISQSARTGGKGGDGIVIIELYAKPSAMGSGGSSGSAWLLGGNALSATGVLGTTSNHGLQFKTNNTDRMIIAANGNVGIGTTSPSQKLSVNGTISLQSGTYAANISKYDLIDQYGFTGLSIEPSGNNSNYPGVALRLNTNGTQTYGMPRIQFSRGGNTSFEQFYNPTNTAFYLAHRAGTAAATSRIYITFGANPTATRRFRLEGDGRGYANSAWTTFSPYLSYNYTETGKTKENYKLGTVVNMSSDERWTVSHSKVENKENVYGVVIVPDGFISIPKEMKDIIWGSEVLGEENEGINIEDLPNVVPIAHLGEASTMVTTKNGSIGYGDMLEVSTLTGFAQKVTTSGRVLGSALESTDHWNSSYCKAVSSIDTINWPAEDGSNPSKPCFRLPDGTYVGKIMVFVNVSWYDPAPGELLAKVQQLENQYNSINQEPNPLNSVLSITSTNTLTVDSHLLSKTNNTYNLGSSTNRWKNVYTQGVISIGENGNSGSVKYDTETKELKFSNDGTNWIALGSTTNTETLSAQYPGSVVTSKDIETGVGEEETGHMHYYEFNNIEEDTESVEISVRYTLPSNFASWSDNAIQLNYTTECMDDEDCSVDMEVFKQETPNKKGKSLTNVGLQPEEWETILLSGNQLKNTCTEPGDTCIIIIRLHSKDNNYVRVGDIKFDYNRKL